MSPKVDPIGQTGSLLLLYFLPHHFDPQHPLSSLHFTACALLTASTIMFALFLVCSFLSPSKHWPLLSICCQLPAGPLHPNLRFSSLSSDPVLGHGLVLTAILLLNTPQLLPPKQGAFARQDGTSPHLQHTVKRTLEKHLSSPQWIHKSIPKWCLFKVYFNSEIVCKTDTLSQAMAVPFRSLPCNKCPAGRSPQSWVQCRVL